MARLRETSTLGRTLPLGFMLPETDWVAPTELPDFRGLGPDLAIDTETRDDGLRSGRGAGWAYGMGRIVGVSMAAGDRRVYVPLAHPDTECFAHDQVRRWLRDHLASNQRHIFQNAPYDLGWIKREFDLDPPELIDDTIGMAFILDENRLTYNLDSLCDWQAVPHKDESVLRAAAEAYGYDAKSELWKLPARYVGPYAEQDAMSTLLLAQTLRPKLEADELTAAYQLEMDVLPLCVEMRRRGIRVDVERADQVRGELLTRRDRALSELSDKLKIGRAVDIRDVASPHWMARVFDAAKVEYPKTEKGNDSFSNEWMAKSEHWLPRLCAEASLFNDAGTKFVTQYVEKYAHMGRIHAEIHQFRDDRGGTITTRFSYSDPPLQQMPSRHPIIAPMIRGLFLPEEGDLWCTSDFSQQEYRLMVHYAIACSAVRRMDGADRAAARYREDPKTDFHQLVADLTGLERRRAKDVNFAKAYGAGPPKFAIMTGLSIDESKSVMGQYDQEMPFISQLSKFCTEQADRRGYVRMLDGARGRFDRWEPRWTDREDVRIALERARQLGEEPPKLTPCSREEAEARVRDPNHPWKGRLRRAMTHKAMNKLIQGSAARQTKMAMRDMWREGIVPMLQMHDDLNFSFGSETQGERAAEIMRDCIQLEVPMKCDVEWGWNWGTAKYSFAEAMEKFRAK